MNKKLLNMYYEDQTERKNIDKNDTKAVRRLIQNDKRRQKAIYGFLKQQLFEDPEDFLRASMILHHGQSLKDYAVAHLLATIAFEEHCPKNEGEPNAEWLMKATKDRWLLSIGKQQIYKTQK
jgi:hypothetical protein